MRRKTMARQPAGRTLRKRLLSTGAALAAAALVLLCGAGAARAEEESSYTIYVNRALNCVTVYAQDAMGELVPVKAMVCSCGREGHRTPLGTFSTTQRYDWRLLVNNTYGRYAVRFNGKILFHSVPYEKRSEDTLEWEEYNRLGQGASLGCVRLSVADAKWIYDNCGRGTEVVVYEEDSLAGPLGKPASAAIPGSSPNKGWDPTDEDPDNPWRNAEKGAP